MNKIKEISRNVRQMSKWVDAGNIITEHFLKTRLKFDDDTIRFYLDHKVLYERNDGKYILNRG